MRSASGVRECPDLPCLTRAHQGIDIPRSPETAPSGPRPIVAEMATNVVWPTAAPERRCCRSGLPSESRDDPYPMRIRDSFPDPALVLDTYLLRQP